MKTICALLVGIDTYPAPVPRLWGCVNDIQEMKAYLEYVRGESRRFFAAGLSTLDAAKRLDLGPYARWTEPERLLFNVERAYREFRGEPFDAPIDAMAIFRGMHELRAALRPAAA